MLSGEGEPDDAKGIPLWDVSTAGLLAAIRSWRKA